MACDLHHPSTLFCIQRSEGIWAMATDRMIAHVVGVEDLTVIRNLETAFEKRPKQLQPTKHTLRKQTKRATTELRVCFVRQPGRSRSMPATMHVF